MTDKKGMKDPQVAKRQPKGDSLTWSPERDIALAKASMVHDRVTAGRLTEILKTDPSFEGAHHLLSTSKIRQRVFKLRKEGVKLPELKRSRYEPAVSDLNALLEKLAGYPLVIEG